MENDQIVVRDLERRRHKAMLDGDIATLEELFDDAFIFTHSDAVRDNKAAYLSKLQQRVFYYSTMDQPEERVSIVGDAALVFGRMVATVHVPAASLTKLLNNSYLAAWSKVSGTWKLLAIQPTPVPAPAPKP